MKKIIVWIGMTALLAAPMFTFAATNSEILAQIQAQILNIQEQLAHLQSTQSSSANDLSKVTTQPSPSSNQTSSNQTLPQQTVNTITPPVDHSIAFPTGGVINIISTRPVWEMTFPINRNHGGDPYLFGTVKSVNDASHITLSVSLSSMLKLVDGVFGGASFAGVYDHTDQILTIPSTMEIPPVGATVVAFLNGDNPPFLVKRIRYIDGGYEITMIGRITSIDGVNRTVSLMVTQGIPPQRRYPDVVGRFNLVGKTFTFYVPSNAVISLIQPFGGSAQLPLNVLSDIPVGVLAQVLLFRVFDNTLVLQRMNYTLPGETRLPTTFQ